MPNDDVEEAIHLVSHASVLPPLNTTERVCGFCGQPNGQCHTEQCPITLEVNQKRFWANTLGSIKPPNKQQDETPFVPLFNLADIPSTSEYETLLRLANDGDRPASECAMLEAAAIEIANLHQKPIKEHLAEAVKNLTSEELFELTGIVRSQINRLTKRKKRDPSLSLMKVGQSKFFPDNFRHSMSPKRKQARAELNEPNAQWKTERIDGGNRLKVTRIR